MKLLGVILGGIADHAVDGLGRRTPLQVARTANLDHLAMLGGCGGYHPTVVGEPVSPSLSLYIMLGNPPELFPGRASFEALARDVKLEEGRFYVLVEPAYVEEGILIESRHFESEEEEAEFFEFVSSKIKQIKRLDFGLYLMETDAHVPSTHPGIAGAPVGDAGILRDLEQIPEAWAGNRLRREKGLQVINRLLFYGCGRFVGSGCSCFPMDTVFFTDSHMFLGLVKWMGCNAKFVPSDSPKEWLTQAFTEVVKRGDLYDAVFVYTDYIHRHNIRVRTWKRVEVIEEMDAAFSVVLDNLLREEVVIMVTSDVTTPSYGIRPYSGLPVPVIMAGEGVRRGLSSKFDEAVAGSGSFGIMRGKELLLTLFSYIGCLAPKGL